MRILLIVFNTVGKGTYWRALYFGRSLAARGHAVTLMATAPRARTDVTERWVEGLQHLEMPDLLTGSLRSGWDVWATLRRLRWLAGRQYDVVHAFEARPTVLFPALKAQHQGAKLVMDWADWFGRGGSVEERPNPLVRAALRPVETYFEDRFRTRADGTTVINRFLGERAVALGVPRETILLLRNGAQAGLRVWDQAQARRELGLAEDEPIVGYVGGIYQRDAEFMAEAFEQVRQARPGVRLLLIGYFNRDIERLLTDSTGIIRTGAVTPEAMHTYLSAADVGWLPLRNSGANRGRWPLKLSDYMAAGRPVVATDVSDLREVIEAGRFGVVTPDEPEQFAAATLALLAEPRRGAALGAEARHAADKTYCWDCLTDKLEAFYQQVLHGPRR